MHKVFNITNKYIVLATPLILFSLITSIYLAVSARGAAINILIAIILFGLMTGAFISGWFNMIKKAVQEPDREEPNLLIKEFTPGVGEYFVSALGVIFNVLVLSLIFTIAAYIIGMKFIGNPGISSEAFSQALENTTALKTFLTSLSQEQLLKLNHWNLLLLGTVSLTYFAVILYLPAIFFKNKNPFKAFFIALKDLFSKYFFETLGIYLLIFIANFIISILTALFVVNPIMHFIMTLVNFYFITYASVGVFYYYFHNFIKNAVGQNLDTRI